MLSIYQAYCRSFKQEKFENLLLLFFCSPLCGRWAQFSILVLHFIAQHAMILRLCSKFEFVCSSTFKTTVKRKFVCFSSITICNFRKYSWSNESFVGFLCQLRNATHRITLISSVIPISAGPSGLAV
jgi:hypothetical protein